MVRLKLLAVMLVLGMLWMLPGENTAAANTVWTLDSFDTHHDFKITFSNTVDPVSLSQISVHDQYGEQVEVVISNAKDPKVVVIEAPENGYYPGEVYEIHINQQVKSSLGEALQDTVIAEFGVNSNHIFGELTSMSADEQSIVIETEAANSVQLHFAEKGKYSYMIGNRPVPVSERFFKELLALFETSYVSYEMIDRIPHFDLIPGKYTGNFDALMDKGILLTVGDTNASIELPLPENAIYELNIENGDTISLSKDAFLSLLSTPDVALEMTYEWIDGKVQYTAVLKKFTGKMDLFNVDRNDEIYAVSLFVGETNNLLDLPVPENAEYVVEVKDGNVSHVSKEEFTRILSTTSIGAEVTYELRDGQVYYTAVLNKFVGQLDAFVGNDDTGIDAMALFIGDTDYLLDFPMKESTAYTVTIQDGYSVDVTKDQFLLLFLDSKTSAQITYELKDGTEAFSATVNEFTGTFAGFNNTSTGGVDGIVLTIGQIDYILDFPMPTTGSYNLQQQNETVAITRQQFIDLLTLPETKPVLYELRDGQVVYTILSE